VLSVVAQRIQIPPSVPVRRERAIERGAAETLSAQLSPDSAAIGTPDPGCTEPPVKKSPRIDVEAPALPKVDHIPAVAAP
jgi:hypothetical protein